MIDFITRANARLDAAALLAAKLDRPTAKELLALVEVVRAAIIIVGDEGCLPARICNAVTRYANPVEWRP